MRGRHARVLAWVDCLALAPGSQVLEIGCGAGFMAIELARRGFRVHAIDSIEAMVELARQNAVESGTSDLLSVAVGDVYTLAFEDGAIDLVVAIGVIPWLERADLAIQEMARVTKSGGHVILTTANRTGLASLLDPWRNPVLLPLKHRLKSLFERIGRLHTLPGMVLHSNRFIDAALVHVGFTRTKGMTYGFGFTFRHHYLPEPLGTTLHRWLQHLADQNIPGIRPLGMAYIVLARKSVPTSSSVQSTKTERPSS